MQKEIVLDHADGFFRSIAEQEGVSVKYRVDEYGGVSYHFSLSGPAGEMQGIRKKGVEINRRIHTTICPKNSKA